MVAKSNFFTAKLPIVLLISILCYGFLLGMEIAIEEEGTLETNWTHFRDDLKFLLPIFEEHLKGGILNVKEIIESILNNQFLVYYAGKISTGKTTCVSSTIEYGDLLLPSNFQENTCMFLFIESENQGDQIRLSISGPAEEREIYSFSSTSANFEKHAEEIKSLIEKENQKCMDMKTVEEVRTLFSSHLILRVPKLRIQNFEQKIRQVDIGGYNIFEGTEINSEIKKQGLIRFASDADAAILLAKVDDLVGGDDFEMQLENILKDRQDFARSHQLIIVFNYLELCLSKDYSMFSEKQRPKNCTKYFKEKANEMIQKIAEKHRDWQLDIPEENIFVLGLKYAINGLQFRDKHIVNEDEERRIEESNIQMFFNRLERMAASQFQNKIESASQRASQLEEETSIHIISKLSEMNAKLSLLQGDQKEYERVYSLKNQCLATLDALSSKIHSIISVHLREIKKSIGSEDSIRSELAANVKHIKLEVKTEFLQVHQEITSLISEYESTSTRFYNFYSNQEQGQTSLYDSIKRFTIDQVNFPDLSPYSWSEQIRSSSHCGKQWHGGAKKCHVGVSKYDKHVEDGNMIFTEYNNRILELKKITERYFDAPKDALYKSFNSFQSQTTEEIKRLNSQKTSLEALRVNIRTLKESLKSA